VFTNARKIFAGDYVSAAGRCRLARRRPCSRPPRIGHASCLSGIYLIYENQDGTVNRSQSVRLTKFIATAIRNGNFRFLVHYGDFKGAELPCSKPSFTAAYKQIEGLLAGAGPVFYTPGDNDWTDCDRRFELIDQGEKEKEKDEAKRKSHSELQRLDLLRRIFFFKNPLNLAKDWEYERQPLYPENALWRSDKVQFGTIHLVGTYNGRVEILMDDVGMTLAQVAARDQANRVWLKQIFERASKFSNEADAVIITTQADVTDPDESAPCTPSIPMNCDAFASLIAQIVKRAADFKKPVLLVHGDTGAYCLDKKFGGQVAPNLWRLNAGGDFKFPLDATVVAFNSGNPVAPFAVSGLVDGNRPKVGC
jgi:hypothetical protein